MLYVCVFFSNVIRLNIFANFSTTIKFLVHFKCRSLPHATRGMRNVRETFKLGLVDCENVRAH